MAKNIVLYGVFLWLVMGLCGGVVGGHVGREVGIIPREVLKKGRELDSNRAKLQSIFRAELGVKEATGKNDGPQVEAYLKVTGLGKGYAWCSSYVSWCFSEAGYPEPRTAWSPSLFSKSRVIWQRGKYLKSGNVVVKPGDVIGLYFANLKRIAHVGFVDEWGDKWTILVEGNTNSAGSNEGDGVYRKRRLISSIYQVADWVTGQENIAEERKVTE